MVRSQAVSCVIVCVGVVALLGAGQPPETAPAPSVAKSPAAAPGLPEKPVLPVLRDEPKPDPIRRFEFKIDPKTPLKDLLPPAPEPTAITGPVLTDDLKKVPEIDFQAQVAPGTKDDAKRATAHQIAKINHVNAKKTDAFLAALRESRPDLAGMPFAMGDACRTDGDRLKHFTDAATTVRRALDASQGESGFSAPRVPFARRVSGPLNDNGIIETQKQLKSIVENQEVILESENLNEMTLSELVDKLAKKYGVTFVILEEYFRMDNVSDIKGKKPKLAMNQLRGLKFCTFLDVVLFSMNATFLVRPDYIEITTFARRDEEMNVAARQTADVIQGSQPAPPLPFWPHYIATSDKQDADRERTDKEIAEQVTVARISALMQMLAAEPPTFRLGLVKHLCGIPHAEATRALARLAIFSAEDDVRSAALTALKVRRERDYTDILVKGLRYPWPTVAKRTADAIARLERTDLVPELLAVLDESDPRMPTTRDEGGKKVTGVRELVKVNHLRNCLLCHAPAGSGSPNPNAPTAEVAVPGQPLPSIYYQQTIPELMIRLDITYLRQDFSASLPVKDSHPWPEKQQFDFFVRERKLTDEEAVSYRDQLTPKEAGVLSPYHKAAVTALRELTGKDAAPTAEAWRKILATPRRE